MRSMCVGVAETGELTHMRSMCVGVAETGVLKFWCGRGSSACADGMEYIFFAFSVGYAWAYIVGRELTHLRSKRGRRRRDGASWV